MGLKKNKIACPLKFMIQTRRTFKIFSVELEVIQFYLEPLQKKTK